MEDWLKALLGIGGVGGGLLTANAMGRLGDIVVEGVDEDQAGKRRDETGHGRDRRSGNAFRHQARIG